jgi:hypothetical protein
MAVKLPWGGGDGSDHSSEFAFHGLAGALCPRQSDHTMLAMKTIWAAPSRKAHTVMKVLTG